MTNFNFDMHRIGRTIAELRRARNMTQMALADEMGVSFQAVSNWERGQSMPDISKLPELAALFSTTIDALLGCHSPLIEKAAEDKLDELPVPTVEEVAEAAPLLPPKQMDALTDKLLSLLNLPDMGELLPFLPTSQVDALFQQQLQKGGNLAQYAVFASTSAVDNAARTLETQEESIHSLLPFISNAALQEIFITRLKASRSINELLPFVDQSLLVKLVQAASTKD